MDNEPDLSTRIARLASMLGTDDDHVLSRAVELGVAVLEGAVAEPTALEIIVSVKTAEVTGSVTRTRPLLQGRQRRTQRKQGTKT